jgi:hypothetical protein
MRAAQFSRAFPKPENTRRVVYNFGSQFARVLQADDLVRLRVALRCKVSSVSLARAVRPRYRCRRWRCVPTGA